MSDNQTLSKMANTLRFLCADVVQQANSGHPGTPMGLSDIAVVLSKHLRHNPKNSKWLNRDRIVFSGGHASSLVYSLLYLWGYDVSMEDLKNFRQLGSKTEGHPEFGHCDGVEITTGPLGQGIANAVGFSMASQYMAHKLNSETAKVIDHKVYCFCGDGDLQEGISYEACALAGHKSLDNLVVIYDSNKITIEGNTDIAWSEDVTKRFEAQGFDVIQIDGHNFEEIENAFVQAKTQTKPLLIIANTKIGRGAVTLEGSHHTHGAPLGAEEIAKSKEALGLSTDTFVVEDDVLASFRVAIKNGDTYEKQWNKLLLDLPLKEQNTALDAFLNPDFNKIEYPTFEAGSSVATRDSNGKILNAIAKSIPNFVGGSADLSPSNKTELKDMGEFPKGKNFRFGIREHSMAAISNAMANYGTLIPFNATFFVFSDYLKPAVRIASLMKAKNYFVWTHDSIGVGEDGPTHQPIEHLTQFRALPNFYTFRPADANENVECWKTALSLNAPAGFVCSRQGLTVLDLNKKVTGDVSKGGYLLEKSDNAKVTLIATGSEVSLALDSAKELNNKGIATNVVSVPCFDLLIEQDKEYINSIIDPNTKVVAIEASRGLEWYRFANEVVCMNSFGASAPAKELFNKFGFTVENVIKTVEELI
jgi:transketolase